MPSHLLINFAVDTAVSCFCSDYC